MKAFLTVLPLAIVMSAGPQIVTAVFLATSRKARPNSLAFLASVTVATTTGTTVFYFLGTGVASGDRAWLDWVLVALLAFLAVRVYVMRNKTEPPRWMGKMESAEPRFAARIGLLLYLLMPTDIVSMATVGVSLARADAPWVHVLGFVAATVLIAGLPFLTLLLLGSRAETVLPKIRNWMSANSWVVSEAVILFFLLVTIFG